VHPVGKLRPRYDASPAIVTHVGAVVDTFLADHIPAVGQAEREYADGSTVSGDALRNEFGLPPQ
jgi:hypothetical protein